VGAVDVHHIGPYMPLSVKVLPQLPTFGAIEQYGRMDRGLERQG
jgi:hypothetical protein